MRLVQAFAFFIASTASALGGPFGIDIGQDISNLAVQESDQAAGLYFLSAPPTSHPSFTDYLVVATPGEGVCQIRAIGREHSSDPLGSSVRSEFDAVRRQLDSGYGESDLFSSLTPSSRLTSAEDWTRAIYRGERHHQAAWREDQGSTMKDGVSEILLTVNAPYASTAYIGIQYTFENYIRCREELDGIGAGVL